MKYKYQVDFEDIKVGADFEKNGNAYIKQSSRTARITRPVEYSGKWFYFGSLEKINIAGSALNR